MEEWNRNKSRIEEINGQRVLSKEHQKLIFLRREQFFYDLFKKNPLIKTPKIYESSGLNLKTYFIETEEKDFLQTAKDWAKVHTYFMNNYVKKNRLIIQHNPKEVSSYIGRNLKNFERLSSTIKKKLSNLKINKNLKTILHGDLQQKNMVTFQGNNYYFDFELGGIGHPGRDIASMIISNPNKKGELLATYRQHINFDYAEFEEDIHTWLILRTAQLYIIFNKRKGKLEQKKYIKRKLSRILESL